MEDSSWKETTIWVDQPYPNDFAAWPEWGQKSMKGAEARFLRDNPGLVALEEHCECITEGDPRFTEWRGLKFILVRQVKFA